jgi:transposase
MHARQVISSCPNCAAQVVLTAALCQEIGRLHAEVTRLQAQVTALQTQLSQTSANSHKPPSSDPPTRARVRMRELSTRQRGGQPGHPGTTRQLRPVAAVDELHLCQPTNCVHCGNPLRGSDPSPLRHQVTELPLLKPTVIEYQLHALHCGQCRGMTRAPLPEGGPGARLWATPASPRRCAQRGVSTL